MALAPVGHCAPGGPVGSRAPVALIAPLAPFTSQRNSFSPGEQLLAILKIPDDLLRHAITVIR